MPRIRETDIRITNQMHRTVELIKYNSQLNDAQKERLYQTPFKWIVDMTTDITMNGVLLRELLSRWDIGCNGFRIGLNTVWFKPLDICFALGLPIVGLDVPSYDNKGCRIKSLFKGEMITVPSIINKLNNLNSDDKIEDFCRVYILLAFFALYFPKSTELVSNEPFHLLDNLNTLNTYNWGKAVYKCLVRSLNRGADLFAKGRNKVITISGCSAVLQIWVIEHLSLNSASTKCFPRINMWTKLTGGNVQIGKLFSNPELVHDCIATEEDKQFDVLVEAIGLAEVRHRVDAYKQFDMEAIVVKQHTLLTQNEDFRKFFSCINEKMKLLKDKLLKQREVVGNASGAGGVDAYVVMSDVNNVVGSDPQKIAEAKKRHQSLIKNLYQFCTRGKADNLLLFKLYGEKLRGELIHCMKPRTWVSSEVMMAATGIMMGDALKNKANIDRFIISHSFTDDVVRKDLPIFSSKSFRLFMSKRSVNKFLTRLNLDDPVEVMSHCNFIFAPTIYGDHWFCYVLDKSKMKLFVLDSLYSESDISQNRKVLDDAVKNRFQVLLNLMHETVSGEVQMLEIIYEDLPKQKNNHDCGIYLMKYMEMWDGQRKWGDKTMLDFTVEDILRFRQEIVCRWVLHPENKQLKDVIKAAKLPPKFSMDSLSVLM